MHSLCIDTYGNLRLKYEKNEDSQAESAIQDWLTEAGYEKDGDDYIIPRDKSSNSTNKEPQPFVEVVVVKFAVTCEVA